MKKLFAIAIAASLLSGLYGFSFGLGGKYVLNHYSYAYGTDSTFSYPAIVADVMCKPLPILGFRIGLVTFNILPEEEKEADFPSYMFGTGCDATVLVFIPMAAMVQPYIPFHFMYSGVESESELTLDGGIGAEMGFGAVMGYLEGGINFWNWSPDVGDSESETWFYVQGGIRVPIGL